MEPSSPFYEEAVRLELEDELVDAMVTITEDGSISVDLDQPVPLSDEPEGVYEEPHLLKEYDEIEGETLDGADVTLNNIIVTFEGSTSPPHLKLNSVTSVSDVLIDGSDNDPFVDQEVTVTVDVTNFKPFIPFMRNAQEYPLISRDVWEAVGVPVDNLSQRVNIIKSQNTPLRTAKINILLDGVNGPPSRQLNFAWERVTKLLELSSFVQGTGHGPIRMTITEVDGNDTGYKYTKLQPVATDIGSAFKSENLVWGDLSRFLDEAYDDYVKSYRDDYRLHKVIRYYLDSINTTRTIDGRFATLINGVELLAQRYSDLGPQHPETEDKIKYVVDQLDVGTEDLAKHSGSFPEKHLPENKSGSSNGWSHEYFYFRARQYLMHGENLSVFEDQFEVLANDYFATLALIQRLIRNQLIDSANLGNYTKLEEIEPTEFSEYD